MGRRQFIRTGRGVWGAWAITSSILLIAQAVVLRPPIDKAAARQENQANHQNGMRQPGQAAGAGHNPRNRWNEGYGKLPLSFEPNQGQVSSRVKFLSRGVGYSLFLTGDEAILELKKSGARSDLRPDPNRAIGLQKSESQKPEGEIGNRKLETGNSIAAKSQSSIVADPLRLKLVDANSIATVTGLDDLPGKSNYFIGNDPKK